MSITVGNITVDGISCPAFISPPPPWTVGYTVGGDGTTNPAAACYEIDENPAVTLPTPVVGANSFQLTASDLPGPGTYLLTVTVWDNANNCAYATCQITLLGVAPPPPPPPPI